MVAAGVAIVVTAGIAAPVVVVVGSPAATVIVGSGAAAGAAAAGGTAAAVGGTAAAVGGTAAVVGGTTAAVGGTAAAVGGTAAAGAASAGATALSTVAGVLSGPVGWIILGTEEVGSSSDYTFDCWKQVLHNDSCKPSNGKYLREVVIDPRIKQVIATSTNEKDLPELILENIWNEQFRIEYVYLTVFNQLAAHAVKIK